MKMRLKNIKEIVEGLLEVSKTITKIGAYVLANPEIFHGLLGAAAGFAVGGPLGAVVGGGTAYAGSALAGGKGATIATGTVASGVIAKKAFDASKIAGGAGGAGGIVPMAPMMITIPGMENWGTQIADAIKGNFLVEVVFNAGGQSGNDGGQY